MASCLEFALLGPPRVTLAGRPVAFDTRKATALLAHLALSGGPRSREALCGLLWPGQDPDHARGALRRTLSVIRSAIGEEWLDTPSGSVGLHASPDLKVDARQFRQLAAGNVTLDELAEAVALFRGPLLEGFALRDNVEFDDWLVFETDALQRELGTALDRLVTGLVARGEYATALGHARRWLALDPLQERAHRELIRLYALSGDRAAALEQYRNCVRSLSREIGVGPSAETTDLYEQVSEGRVTAPVGRRRSLPSGTLTLVFTDIEGSTRLLHEHGAGYAEVLGRHRRLIRSAAERHHGVEVQTDGDAFFLVFETAQEAAAAALEAQAALERSPIRVRIGMHTGQPEIYDDDYVGVDVCRAERIAAAAHGGQIVLSERTSAEMGANADCTPLGLHRLKDLPRPEKLFQLGPGVFPPLRSLNASNLSAQPTHLVGREAEVAAVRRLLSEHRLVTLTGPGGIGKTRVALEATAASAGSYDDGVWWAPLAAVTDPELVLPTVAQALGAQASLAEHVDERRMLILLDNLEQVAGCARELAALLEACPNLTLLATSRVLLRLRAEREYPVPGLPLDDAVALFVARAVRAEPLESVRAICERVDALPLAIELSAARTSAIPPDDLLAALDRRLAVLTEGPVDAPDRHLALRATIEWSYDLLAPDEREHFARLSVFAGGFDAADAEAVCGTAPQVLDMLADQSLLGRAADGRGFMLETIREFAAEKLGLEPALRRRHAEHYLELARSAALTDDSSGPMQHDLIVADRDNVRAALDWAGDGGDVETGLRLAAALENYWVTNAPIEGARRLGDLLERAPEPVAGDLLALTLRVHGAALTMAGDSDGGRRRYEQALAQYRTNGDRHGAGMVLGRLGQDALQRGDIERTRGLAAESARLAEDTGFVRGQAIAAQLLAGVERAEGRPARAAELLERSAELAAKSDFTWWQAATLLDLVELDIEQGHTERAEATLRRALVLLERVGDRQNIVYTLAMLAGLVAHEGRRALAGQLWGAIEAEEGRGPIGLWEQERDQYATAALAAGGPAFEAGRAEGRTLTLSEAVSLATAGRRARSTCSLSPLT